MSQHSNPSRRSRKPIKIAVGVGAALLLTLGSCGAGMAAAGGPPEVQTVTKTIKVPSPAKTVQAPAKVVEVPGPEKIVEVTPMSCVNALDVSGQVNSLAADALEAASNDDLDRLAEVEDEINSLDADAFSDDLDDCLSKADASASDDDAGFDL